MSYEEGAKCSNLYPETSSALITPPKDPHEQPLLAVNPIPNRGPSSAASFKHSCHRPEEPFTPIKTTSECESYEPLPYTCNIFEGALTSPTCNNQNLWQLVYSPLHATPRSDHTGAEHEDGEQTWLEGNRPYLPGLSVALSTPGKPRSLPGLNEAPSTPGKPSSKNDEPEDNDNNKQLPNDNVKDSAEKPPPYPHHHNHHWPMYPPHPYYWYQHYHYGYPHHYGGHDEQQDNRRLSRPTQYHHAYRASPPYGHYGSPRFAANHPQPAQEYITDVTNNDVICGRGGAVNNHPGNRRFRQFIQEFKHQYLNETKQRKPFVAMRVLEAVKNSNPPGRFLVKHPGGYLECGDDRAREKASQALREGAAKLRKQGYGVENNGVGEASTVDSDATQKRGLQLPNERAREQNYYDDSNYSREFDPPQKKIKREAV